MNCEEVIDLYLEQQENEDATLNKAINSHLESCNECRRKIEEMSLLLTAIKAQPEPELPEMSQRFAAFMKDQQTVRTQGAIVRALSKQLWLAASLIFVVGLAILFVLLTKKDNQPTPELVNVTDDSKNPFTNASTSIRIEAITQIDSSSRDQQLLESLSQILLQDKNSNVRMAALYSLADHLSNPTVYAVFIQALKTEKDPVLQVLLINTIAKQKSPKSVEAIQSLINNSATRTEVRTVAEQTIKTL
jgi:hypothetical protein